MSGRICLGCLKPQSAAGLEAREHAERLEAIRTTLGWDTVGGLGGDSALERELGGRQVRNFFGLQLQGVAVPDYEEDY